MVLASSGLLLTPPFFLPPEDPSPALLLPNSIPEEKSPPPQTVPAPVDENLTYTITQTPSNVQSRLINTCHDALFAPHVGTNINAG
jgi:hypothetical protein